LKNHNLAKSSNFRSPKSKNKDRWRRKDLSACSAKIRPKRLKLVHYQFLSVRGNIWLGDLFGLMTPLWPASSSTYTVLSSPYHESAKRKLCAGVYCLAFNAG